MEPKEFSKIMNLVGCDADKISDERDHVWYRIISTLQGVGRYAFKEKIAGPMGQVAIVRWRNIDPNEPGLRWEKKMCRTFDQAMYERNSKFNTTVIFKLSKWRWRCILADAGLSTKQIRSFIDLRDLDGQRLYPEQWRDLKRIIYNFLDMQRSITF